MSRDNVSYKGTRNPVFTTHREEVTRNASFEQATRRAYGVDETRSALGGGEGPDGLDLGTDAYLI